MPENKPPIFEDRALDLAIGAVATEVVAGVYNIGSLVNSVSLSNVDGAFDSLMWLLAQGAFFTVTAYLYSRIRSN